MTSLPYSNGKKVTGVFERKMLLKILLSLNVLENMKVNEVMTTPVLTIDAKANLAQAKSTMRDKKINRLLVMQNDKFAGLITNHDMISHYTKSQERRPMMKDTAYAPSNIAISSVMETNTMQVQANRDVSEAVRDMVENKVSSLVVMKGSRPIGMLTVTDIFEGILTTQKSVKSKVFMSGFDQATYPYEDGAREELTSLIEHIQKMSGIDVDYLTFKVKHPHTKLYEMQVRLSLGRHGIISMHTTKYLFDDALNDLIKKLKHRVIKEKEIIITHKKEDALREV
jgi:CBS domain-containing protein